MVGALPLPEAFRWARTFHLQGCTGLGQLHLDGGTLLRIEDCPGLLSLRVDGAVERIEIKRCPDLKSVRLAQVGPPSARFSKLPNLRFNQENMQIEFPSPKARSAFADQGPGLRLEDCPALTSLRMGAGDLGMRKFGKMESRSQPSWVWSMMVERKS